MSFTGQLLNGPITLSAVIIGSVANLLTIYVLSIKTLQRNRTSVYNSPLAPRKVPNQIKNDRPEAPVQRRFQSRNQSSLLNSSTRPRIYTFFMWLAISDSFLLLSALLMYCVPNLLDRRLGIYVRFFRYFYLMSNATLTASVWLMCSLMFDRYKTLCSPFTVRSGNINRIHRILLTVCLIAIIFSLPRFFEISVELDSSTGIEYVTQTSLVHNKIYMIGYRIFGGLMLYSLMPYLVLFVLSFKVWLVIRSAAMTRLKMSASATNPTSMVLYSCATDSEMILIAVTSKFLLSRLIPTMLDVVEHVIGPEQFTRSSTLTLCVDISNLIVVTSSGINLFIFYAFSASFRKSLLMLINVHVANYRQPITSPQSNLSTVTVGVNARNNEKLSPSMPRQLSLQAYNRRKRPGELNRKGTFNGTPLSNSKAPKSPLANDQQQTANLLQTPAVELVEVQHFTPEEPTIQHAVSLP